MKICDVCWKSGVVSVADAPSYDVYRETPEYRELRMDCCKKCNGLLADALFGLAEMTGDEIASVGKGIPDEKTR